MSGSVSYTVFTSGRFDFNLQTTSADTVIRIEDAGAVRYSNAPYKTSPGTLFQMVTASANYQTQLFLGEAPAIPAPSVPSVYIRGSVNSGSLTSWGGWLPVPVGVAHSSSIAALRAMDVSGFGSEAYIALADGYLQAGDGGGGTFDWSMGSLLRDDSVVVFKPAGINASNPGRWIRRLVDGALTPEMAGAIGDYDFNLDTGTNNLAAFVALFNAAGYSTLNGQDGASIRLSSGRRYLLTSSTPTSITVTSGISIEGAGYPRGYTESGSLSSLFLDGSVLVIDSSVLVILQLSTAIRNTHVIRRGLAQSPIGNAITPTTAQVQTFWAEIQNEGASGSAWVPSTNYSAGALVTNLGAVYICDISGMSAPSGNSGPSIWSTVPSSVLDGTVKWHLLNPLTWNAGQTYVAGTRVTSFGCLYACDTGGVAGGGRGPVGSSTAPNSIIDGTARWHFLNVVSTGLYTSDGDVLIENVTIIGFYYGFFAASGGQVFMRNCFMDNFNNVDARSSGDSSIYDNIRCVSIYGPVPVVVPATSVTASGNVLDFASVPATVGLGDGVSDATTAGAIPASAFVVGLSSTTVTLSASVSASVQVGDAITFTDLITFAAASASSPMGSQTLNFNAVPPKVLVGDIIADANNPSAIATNTHVTAVAATSVTLSSQLSSTVAAGDVIGFTHNWRRKTGVSFYVHDRADGTRIVDCGTELWAIGYRLSNVWGVSLSRCGVETGSTNVNDAGYQLQNMCSYTEFDGCYGSAPIVFDIQSTDYANASIPPNYLGYQTSSLVLVRGGQIGSPGPFLGVPNTNCLES